MVFFTFNPTKSSFNFHVQIGGRLWHHHWNWNHSLSPKCLFISNWKTKIGQGVVSKWVWVFVLLCMMEYVRVGVYGCICVGMWVGICKGLVCMGVFVLVCGCVRVRVWICKGVNVKGCVCVRGWCVWVYLCWYVGGWVCVRIWCVRVNLCCYA